MTSSNRIDLRDLDAPGPAKAEEQAAGSGTDWAADQVAPGRRVRLHFSLALSSGELVDGNFGRKPVEFIIGDGNMLPGFENAAYGMRAGERRQATLSPAQAFGEWREANVVNYPRYQFPADLDLEAGLMLSFSDPAGNEQAGVVKEADKSTVQVDFNHPLAGRDIVFTVEILSVTETDND